MKAVISQYDAAYSSFFKPFARAYALGYITTISPKVCTILLSCLGKSQRDGNISARLSRVLRRALALNRFPAFCGALVGGTTVLQLFISLLIKRLRDPHVNLYSISLRSKESGLVTFISTFIAAWFSLQLLNGESPYGPTKSFRKGADQRLATTLGEAPSEEIEQAKRTHMAGRTMDLTLFVSLRALDVAVGELWQRRKSRRLANQAWTKLEALVGSTADAGVFALSSGAVMWAWFYFPQRLPRAYNTWIREAAEVDDRLVEALRRVRRGEFVYGKETGQASLLQAMCNDYGWPLEWGDPVKTVPIPCEMVHMGVGPSCELHAASRFAQAFKFAFAMYMPLNLFMRLRSPSKNALKQALIDATRSSAFLGAFVSLFYYSVCLSRTRIGPKIFSRKTITPQMWDGGLDVGAGCATCGWSIMLEMEKRRHEVAFFVAPRAAATLFPRKYDKKYQWRETLAFALSMAVIFTCVQEKPERVRGVFGRLLKQVLNRI